MVNLMKKDCHMETMEQFANYDIAVKVVIQRILKKREVKSGLVI